MSAIAVGFPFCAGVSGGTIGIHHTFRMLRTFWTATGQTTASYENGAQLSMLGKSLLLCEATICFAAALFNVALGLLFLPAQAAQIFRGELEALRILPWMLLTVAGFIGSIGMFSLISKIINPGSRVPTARVLWVLILSWSIPLAYLLVLSGGGVLSLFNYVLPLLCTAHLVYLGRHYLFGRQNHSSHGQTG